MSTDVAKIHDNRLTRLGKFERIPGLLRWALVLWTLVGVGGLLLLLAPSTFQSGDRLYLLPWCVAVGAVTIAPVVFLAFKGKFDPFHPLIYPVWTYFFPGFAIGGLVLATGYSQAHYIAYIRDEAYDLPLTFLYIIIGFCGLVVGFSFPLSRRLGEIVGSWLPKWEMSDSEAMKGGLILLALGLTSVSFAFFLGLLGFQRPDEMLSFGGLVSLSTVFWYQATFILALNIFRTQGFTAGGFLILAGLLASALANALLAGSRSGLLHFSLPILAAYLYSGRKVAGRQYFGFGLILAMTLVAGMIYGTTFRNIRETQQMVSFEQYVAVVPDTFERILNEDPIKVLEDGMSALSTRIELVSSVAVVVSNYEILAPYEEELGISNNILVETITFFIPRIIWNDKPVSIEPVKYAELYFNFSENSFSMTPIADLLRNFGPLGIPVGMFILGGLLRIVHVSLLDRKHFSYWRLTLFFILVTGISYDGTYGGIVPTMFKTAVVATLGFVIVWLVTVRLDRQRFKA